MTAYPFILPLVAKYPPGSRGKQPHWTQQVPCPRCGEACWAPGGYEDAVKSGSRIMCTECNTTGL